ncbi:MAG TPA: hypothetical protein VD767_10485, partial [Thermomicrobiales bacterium]|nr:hypothetical protein [Thermomicrobiales bacterium]
MATSKRSLVRTTARREPTSDVLVSQTFHGLSAYLRRSPTKGFRGGNERSAHGIHCVMKDWRAFVRWAHEEG